MKRLVLYVHGKGGSAAESEHYAPLFPGCTVLGLEYRAFTPWEAGQEIHDAVQRLHDDGSITLIANSIGAFFCMHADIEAWITKAYFISPVVDMEQLILAMMHASQVTEAQLQAAGEIETAFGETLSWEYLCFVRAHPVRWRVPTDILFGENDTITSLQTITAFAKAHGARLTVMPQGEHWFHTPEQMRVLDAWVIGAVSY